MTSRYFVILSVVLLLMEHIRAIDSIPYETKQLAATGNDRVQGQTVKLNHLVRRKRAPFGKLALLGGAALGAKVLGKKALLLGGAALGAKALLGAGIVGAGLYKAKNYSGGGSYNGGGSYASGYTSYQNSWGR
ncbi:uncharacterized protein LOC122401391 isoform X2 [Colletes gigas]|uniref:uncharacterized protein LOC122401391 isoform X2 n=1 Tax=Colletes gigas TaxID=935657 RepID=UPI001C9AA079|nr:uncharacterized protein LOC122401391 isoform X2 [Colletes gigas]